MGELPVVEKYRNIDDKIFMSLDEALILSRYIADHYRNQQIDRVIGVPNGGLLMTKVVAEALGVPFELVVVRRKGSVIKGRLSRYGWLKRFVSVWYSIPVIRYPLYKAMERMSTLTDDDNSVTLNLDGASRILVVDDSVDTGQSLERVLSIVSDQAPRAHVESAVICIETLIPDGWRSLDPDYHISPRMQHFPWSANSPDYEKYQQWLGDNGMLQHQI